MNTQFITKEKIHANITDFSNFLFKSNGYEDLYSKIKLSEIEYEEDKTYEVIQGNFIDFNQHLYEDINHMNSISSGIYIEKTLITFRIFIWTAKGQGFEIFKHILMKEEISKINNIDDAKEYIYKHLNELQQGIIKTYSESIQEAFEKFGLDIETQKLPLSSLFNSISIQNNIKDFISN